MCDEGMESSIHAEYQNSIGKHVLPRPSHGTPATFLRFENDISAKKKKVYELSGKALLQNRKWTGLVAHRPWQALPVVNSWAASAYCKLHTLIFLIIYFLAHNTFMHRTSEALSGSHVELEQFLAIWI